MLLFQDEILAILRSTILDNFPDMKELSCECVLLLARALPTSIKLNGVSSLMDPLTKILAHQQKKVRIAAIKAIGEYVILLGSSSFYLILIAVESHS